MINNEFKAVFNPFTRALAVAYGTCLYIYTFSELDEWVQLQLDGDNNAKSYLHVHLHYDESLQLLFYPREDGSSSLNEDKGVYFNSDVMSEVPDKIKLVYNDAEWLVAFKKIDKGCSIVKSPVK